MITQETRSAIAVVSLEFNELEFVLILALTGLLHCRDNDVGELAAGAVRDQVGCAKRIAEHYAQEYPGIRPETSAFIDALKSIRAIRERRNELVHAITSIETGTEQSILVNVKKSWQKVDIDITSLEHDIASIKKVKAEILTTYGELRRALGKRWFPVANQGTR